MKRSAALAALLAGSLLLGACGKADEDKATDDTTNSADGAADGAVKAAWIYVGPTTDGGWTTAHDNGRKAVEKALGDKVETTFKENIPEGPEVAAVIEDLVKDGNKIIFATSFGFGDAMKAAAEKHPDVKFEHATGIPNDIKNFTPISVLVRKASTCPEWLPERQRRPERSDLLLPSRFQR